MIQNGQTPPTLVDPSTGIEYTLTETSTLTNCPEGHVRMDPYPAPCYPKCRGGFAWSPAAVGGSGWPTGGCGISDASVAWDYGGADIRQAEAENCGSRFTKAEGSATGYIQCIAPGEDGGKAGFCLNHKQGRPEEIIECVPENHSDGESFTSGGKDTGVGYESDPTLILAKKFQNALYLVLVESMELGMSGDTVCM